MAKHILKNTVISAFDANNQNTHKSGFEQIKCGSDVTLWTTPVTPSTVTTTASTNTGKRLSTVTNDGTSTVVASTSSPTNTSTSTDDYSTATDGQYAPSKIKDDHISMYTS